MEKITILPKAILVAAIKVGIGFFILSFFLRLIFFTSYFSLFFQPLVVFLGWTLLISGVLLFLKHDFPAIYKLFIPNDEAALNGISAFKMDDKKKIDISEDGDLDYEKVFNQSDVENETLASSPENADVDLPERSADEGVKKDEKTFGVEEFVQEDPKNLARVVKKFINE